MTSIINNDYYAECSSGFIVLIDRHNLHEEVVGSYVKYNFFDKETDEEITMEMFETNPKYSFANRQKNIIRKERHDLSEELSMVEFEKFIQEFCRNYLGI